MFRDFFVILGLLFMLNTTSAAVLDADSVSGSVKIEFLASSAPLINPERGFWKFVADDFLAVNEEDLIDIRDNGLTVAYAIVRLDAFRNTELSFDTLNKLERAFAKTRKAGIKVILRFAYNYPQSSTEYEDAKDASLDIVLQHIKQLAPVINQNKDVLVVMQAGFIGAWGEAHTSSNGLDSDDNKRTIRDALLAALHPSIAVQWRYAPDVIAWQSELSQEMRERTAFHNDCFLSSLTDVGTYSNGEKTRLKQRKIMETLTSTTYFSGETCDAQKEQIRKNCKNILEEGAQFHVSALGLDYYTEFHKTWKKQGCFAQINRQLGYRFELQSARFLQTNSLTQRLSVSLKNVGWAKLYKERPLSLEAFSSVGDLIATGFSGDLSLVGPNETREFIFDFLIVDTQKGDPPVYCVSAHDPEDRLSGDPRYSIKFANADNKAHGQEHNSKLVKFCFQRP